MDDRKNDVGTKHMFFVTAYSSVKRLMYEPDLDPSKYAGSDKTMKTLSDVQRTGKAFPSYRNFAAIIDTANQFMNGRVDWEILEKAHGNAEEDKKAAAPFGDAFPALGGLGIDPPVYCSVFREAHMLINFIRTRVNDDGLVTGGALHDIGPDDLKILKRLTGQGRTLYENPPNFDL